MARLDSQVVWASHRPILDPRSWSTTTTTEGKWLMERQGKNERQNKCKTRAGPITTSTHVIAVEDFVPLAECIAASTNPVISVPEALYKTINRVIAMRSGFGKKLGKHGVEQDPLDDVRHSYLSMFSSSGLEVYEPSERFLNAPSMKRPEKTAQDKVVYEAEPPITLQDAFFVFWVMLQDLEKIRDCVREIRWRLLPGRKPDHDEPAAIAIAANSVIGCARSIIEDASTVFEDHGSAYAVCQAFSQNLNAKKGALRRASGHG
ncbi:hypothetical protein B0J13DRAFT_529998 [Dactylonectria estremocensis]|uniref:DUF6604 domain-containing protein n=1 Tax=Dactylonectria estremocensis TaxID=1079267 RepID=A0A9P9E1X5_9HYPO|nr:hypothetical protein B0J13DRAFT_529998 [Dactylonectria estremocensis]